MSFLNEESSFSVLLRIFIHVFIHYFTVNKPLAVQISFNGRYGYFVYFA